MFTGIVTAVGTVLSIDRREAAAHVRIGAQLDDEPLTIGESIAVNGTCVTVTEADPNSFSADISQETLNITTLGNVKEGDAVNLERPLRLGDSLGGHLVSGHVDGVGTITSVTPEGEGYRVAVRVPEPIAHLVVHKGSVALDGISLTVASREASSFTVALIPHTWRATCAHAWERGAKVNVEVDLIGRYVQQFIAPFQEKQGA